MTWKSTLFKMNSSGWYQMLLKRTAKVLLPGLFQLLTRNYTQIWALFMDKMTVKHHTGLKLLKFSTLLPILMLMPIAFQQKDLWTDGKFFFFCDNEKVVKKAGGNLFDMDPLATHYDMFSQIQELQASLCSCVRIPFQHVHGHQKVTADSP